MPKVLKKTPIQAGQQYGRLTVIEPLGKTTYGRMMWRCLCRCGNYTQVQDAHLKSRHTRSCGCLHDETVGNAARTHGRSKTRTHRIWTGMKSRCKHPGSTSWKYYGALGISYDPRWESFEHFLEDMGEAPDGYSLDRLDSKSNYTKMNCRWATALQQSNNAASNRLLTFQGKTQNLTEWAHELDIKPPTLFDRIYRGWSIERALTTPGGRKRREF